MPGLKSSKLMTFTHFLLTLKTSILYNPEELFPRSFPRRRPERSWWLMYCGRFFMHFITVAFPFGGESGSCLSSVPLTVSCPNSPRATVAACAWRLALVTFADRSGCEPRLDYFSVSVLNQCKIQHVIMLGKL